MKEHHDQKLVFKQLREGEVRFEPRARTTGRNTAWNVYDKAKGSYPVHIPGFGRVKEGFKTEQEAQVEADRLTEYVEEGGKV